MKRMKRWISLVLALSLMLSACPVSVYAETGETAAAVLETAAATEASAESLETMVTVTESPEIPETVSEPPETTQATEPPETTQATEPPETTAPAETTEAAEPEYLLSRNGSISVCLGHHPQRLWRSLRRGICRINQNKPEQPLRLV